MKLRKFVVALVLPLAIFAASAAERVDCLGDTFELATSVAQLPAEVRAALSQSDPMADGGEPFNSTDAIDQRLGRRFAAAAAGSRRVIAAVEEGGIGYHVAIWSFELDDSHWTGLPLWTTAAAPSSVMQLLPSACARKGKPAPSERSLLQNSVSCSIDSLGTFVTIQDGPYDSRYQLIRTPDARGTLRFKVIDGDRSLKRAPDQDRAEFAAKLRFAQAAMEVPRHCRGTVARILTVLTDDAPAN